MIREEAARVGAMEDTVNTAFNRSEPAQEELILRRRRRRERILTLTSPVVLIVVWEALSRAGVIDKRFFPAPSAVVGTFSQLAASGALLTDTLDTLARVAVGLLLGGIPGLLLGVVMGLSPVVRAFFKSIVASLFPIPKIAILPHVPTPEYLTVGVVPLKDKVRNAEGIGLDDVVTVRLRIDV